MLRLNQFSLRLCNENVRRDIDEGRAIKFLPDEGPMRLKFSKNAAWLTIFKNSDYKLFEYDMQKDYLIGKLFLGAILWIVIYNCEFSEIID